MTRLKKSHFRGKRPNLVDGGSGSLVGLVAASL